MTDPTSPEPEAQQQASETDERRCDEAHRGHIAHYSHGCPRCGAPQCCVACCEISTLQQQFRQNGEMEEG